MTQPKTKTKQKKERKEEKEYYCFVNVSVYLKKRMMKQELTPL